MQVFKAQIGICGPLFIVGFGQPTDTHTGIVVDGFIITPDELPTAIYLRAESKSKALPVDLDLEQLIMHAAEEKARDWIDAHKSKLTDFLISKLEFSAVEKTEQLFLTYKGYFDPLDKIDLNQVSFSTMEMIEGLKKYPPIKLN
jgi:hypothetical protein